MLTGHRFRRRGRVSARIRFDMKKVRRSGYFEETIYKQDSLSAAPFLTPPRRVIAPRSPQIGPAPGSNAPRRAPGVAIEERSAGVRTANSLRAESHRWRLAKSGRPRGSKMELLDHRTFLVHCEPLVTLDL